MDEKGKTLLSFGIWFWIHVFYWYYWDSLRPLTNTTKHYRNIVVRSKQISIDLYLAGCKPPKWIQMESISDLYLRQSMGKYGKLLEHDLTHLQSVWLIECPQTQNKLKKNVKPPPPPLNLLCLIRGIFLGHLCM